MSRDDPKEQFGDYVAILANLHAYRTRHLPAFRPHTTDIRVENLQRQVGELQEQMGTVVSALNEAWKAIDSSKKVTV